MGDDKRNEEGGEFMAVQDLAADPDLLFEFLVTTLFHAYQEYDQNWVDHMLSVAASNSRGMVHPLSNTLH